MSFWIGKQVLVTGHTGFKGAWLSLWLNLLGARVTGVSLQPDTTPSLFAQLELAALLEHRVLDIRDAEALSRVVRETKPDVVLHLAAQSLVLCGYQSPVETWATNVMGVVHILEAMRGLDKLCAAVIVTTDKIYENNEWEFGYRENDPLGGHDPYSASKAGAEIAVSSWRRSFFPEGSPIRVATARAGNVIGGGDWAANRIIPDIVRALQAGEPIKLRNPGAIRPWQHVLEPLGGYMRLAQALAESPSPVFGDAFNFGPRADANRTVGDLVNEALRHWPGGIIENAARPGALHEAGRLTLTIDRAQQRLGWCPRWDFARSVKETMDWYCQSRALDAPRLRELSLRSIRAFEADEHATY